MKRYFCKKCNTPLHKGEICTNCGYTNERHTRGIKTTRMLILIAAVILIVGGIIVCNAMMLLPWQWDARRNRSVILEYAAEHYPEAQNIDSHYNSAQFFIWNNFRDRISFESEGVEFNIIAENGKIIADGYPKARACKQFDEIIQDGFLKPRGIEVQTGYNYSDDYYEIYPYTGGLGVTVRIRDQGATPQEIGWLYDFYKYWKESADFLKSYSVYIDIVTGDEHHAMRYNKSSEFATAEEFYAIFE